jgi:hypothetical protein
MTSISLEAAIQQSDDDASNSHLYKLISARDFSGPTLPSVAENYLETFCNTNLSVVRRRWIGIALAGMLEKPKVAAHFTSSHLLHNLGAIVLSGTEQEQTKIVTGIIIRQALEQGIEYSSFWSSEKVRHGAPTFPLEADARWMHNFQIFLDALSDLALTKPTSEPSITYLVSLLASDEFRWRESTTALPIALIEGEVMTIIAPDEYLKECHFVEIPIEHILSTRLEPSTLHDSQTQHTEHEPWDLIMTLKSNPWSYRLNSAQRVATDMSLMFKHSEDALEWESCIKAHKKVHTHHPNTSRNLPVDASSPSIRCSNVRRSLRSGTQPRRTEHATTKKSSDSISLRSRTRTPRAGSQALQELQPQHQSTTSKRTTHTKGKLPRVSQAAKHKIFKKLNAEADAESKDFDIDIEDAHTDPSGTPSVTPSPQKKSQGSKTAPCKKATESKSRARISHIKHTTDDDEDFIPTQTKSKKKTNPKRKAAPDTTAESKPTKRPHIQPSKGVKSNATGSKQQGQTYPLTEPPKSLSPVLPLQHTLIGGLLGSQRPTNVSDLSFKKPTLPARIAQTPSTPTNPNRKLVEALSRPKTPMEARRRFDDDALQYMASSPPPIADEFEDSNEWHEILVETAILSSNSKPTPASPNAESTAISGHADCNDVASEKKTGDWQTAKSDPFSRRSAGKKATSFIRRLTGEESTNEDASLDAGISDRMPVAIVDSSTSKTEASIATNQPHPQKMPWEKKRPYLPEIDANNSRTLPKNPSPRTFTKSVDVISQQIPDIRNRAKQSSRPMPNTKTQQKLELVFQQDNSDVGEYTEHCDMPNASTTLSKETKTTPSLLRNEVAAENDVTQPILVPDQQIVDFTQPTIQPGQQPTDVLRNSIEETQQAMEYPQQITEETQQVVDDPPIEQAPNRDHTNLEDDTLVGDGKGDQQADNELIASPVNFRSSPPRPGSPSSHSSTSAAPEPLTDPPLPCSQAEEMEWEASLQPHQRDLHELMIRTSKRVMRHITDNETSVTDIAEMYAQDGEHVLNTLLQLHKTDHMHVFQGMESTKVSLRKDLERAAKQMAKERRRVNTIA